MRKELEKLFNGEVKSVRLKSATPSELEKEFDYYELNDTSGWDCDYWSVGIRDNVTYNISGSAWHGTATVSLRCKGCERT